MKLNKMVGEIKVSARFATDEYRERYFENSYKVISIVDVT